ncbi:MAG: CRISPR-associated endonuclease Cas2 [Candidatus Caenarcaniphilales bacterium]|nr:CRISPR-associated endonuclease Cas2 [Candidatus Caenarcaniphilales bacterium]
MFVVVSYDVAETDSKEGAKRLRKIAQACKNHGQRVQFSVFECNVNDTQLTKLKQSLLKIFDPLKDSLRFYNLGSSDARIEHYGQKPTIDFEEPLIL